MAKKIETKISQPDPIPDPIPTAVSDSKVLTVVVLDTGSKPVSGANVSITPANASGVTNSSGEIRFTLGNEIKYDITATADGKTVTVPYYVTKDGATRLVVNPVYVKSVEAQLQTSFWSGQTLPIVFGGMVFIAIVYLLVRKYRK